jgi:hypothetical protein
MAIPQPTLPTVDSQAQAGQWGGILNNAIAGLVDDANGELAQRVQAPPGVTDRRILLPSDGVAALAGDIILSDQVLVQPSQQLALDVDGGVVGGSCSIDAAVTPAAAAADGAGVLVMAGGHRHVIRVRVFDTRLDRVQWLLAVDSSTGVTGAVALADATTGEVLRSATGVNFGASVNVPTGWTPSTPLTGLTPGQEVLLVLQPPTGSTVRLWATPATATLANITGQRTTGSVKRAVSANVSDAAMPSTLDLTTGWTIRACPVVVAIATS